MKRWTKEQEAAFQKLLEHYRPRALEEATRKALADLAHLRKQYDRVRAMKDALHQFVACAAKGGHPDAKAYVESIFNEYGPEPEEAVE